MPSANSGQPRRQRHADPQILAAARLLENLAYLYPEAYEVLAQRQRDAMAPGGRGYRPKVSGSRGASSVETALVSDEHIEFLMSEIVQRAVQVAQEVYDFNELLRLYATPPPRETVEATEPDDRKLCDCTGREGADVWGRPTCGARPVRDGLCNACWFREYRWRKAEGLPPRTHDDAGDAMPDGYHTPGPPPSAVQQPCNTPTSTDVRMQQLAETGVLRSAEGGLGPDLGEATP